MEESEKRRERLNALRREAAQTEVSHDNAETSAGSGGQLMPFSEASGNIVADELCAPPRFDYYTDPMSAFSGNKKRTAPATQSSSNVFSTPSTRIPEMTPSPVPQRQNCYSANQRFQQTQGPTYNSGAFRSPREVASPYTMPQASTPATWDGYGRNDGYCYPSNSPRGVRSLGPGCGPFSSPSLNYGQPQYFSGSPGHAGNPGPCSPGFGYRPVSSSSVQYGRGGPQYVSSSSGYGYGRGRSPYHSSGRGQGHWNRHNSPASGRSGEASKGPEQYFLVSMLEDPWKDLKPVVWNVKVSSNNSSLLSSKSRFFESSRAKKPRVVEASDKSASQPSLAEVLAAAFNEASADGLSK